MSFSSLNRKFLTGLVLILLTTSCGGGGTLRLGGNDPGAENFDDANTVYDLESGGFGFQIQESESEFGSYESNLILGESIQVWESDSDGGSYELSTKVNF